MHKSLLRTFALFALGAIFLAPGWIRGGAPVTVRNESGQPIYDIHVACRGDAAYVANEIANDSSTETHLTPRHDSYVQLSWRDGAVTSAIFARSAGYVYNGYSGAISITVDANQRIHVDDSGVSFTWRWFWPADPFARGLFVGAGIVLLIAATLRFFRQATSLSNAK